MYSCLFLLCSESRVYFRFGRCQFDDGRSSHSSACGFSLSPENNEQCFVLLKFFGTCSSVPTNPFSWMISRWGRASGKHWAGRAPKGDMYLEGDCLGVGFVLMENRIIQHSMRLYFGQQLGISSLKWSLLAVAAEEHELGGALGPQRSAGVKAKLNRKTKQERSGVAVQVLVATV